MPDRDDRPQADAIDRYWDEVFRGRPAGAAPDALDPDLAATVRRLRALDAAPAADPGFAARLWADLIRGEEAPLPQPLPEPRRFEPTMTATSLPMPFPLEAPRTRRRGVAWFAAAALVIAALGLGYRAFWPDPTDRSLPIPAAAIPATAAPTPTAMPTPTPVPIAATAQTLLTLTFPADALRRDDRVSAGLGHFSIPPGKRSTWTPYCCPGPLVEYVVAGVYTVRAEAKIRVVRADGTTEEIATGTEAVLGPGDALVSRNETVVEGANTGTAPVELLGWVLIGPGGGVFGGHSLPGWIDHNADVQDRLTVPPGGATVHLRRVELDADTVYPAPPSGAFSFAVTLQTNTAGTPVAGYGQKGTDGSLAHAAGGPVTFYVLTLEPSGLDGTPTAGTPTAGTPTP